MTWWTAVGHAQQLPAGNSTESVTLARPSRMSGNVRPQVAVIVAMIALTACGSSTAVPARHHPSRLPVQHHLSPVARAPSGPPAQVAVIVMENEEYGGIIGSPSAPYINSLARRYALATGMYGISHPSLPNYLALTGGSTFGIDSDCTDCTRARARAATPRRTTRSLCHNMHDCSVSTGDRFLSTLVPGLLRSLGKGGLLFLTWDEGSSDAWCCRLAFAGHIVTIVAGPEARARARLAKPIDHYSVLQTIEDVLGLERLRGAACGCTPSLAPLLARGRG